MMEIIQYHVNIKIIFSICFSSFHYSHVRQVALAIITSLEVICLFSIKHKDRVFFDYYTTFNFIPFTRCATNSFAASSNSDFFAISSNLDFGILKLNSSAGRFRLYPERNQFSLIPHVKKKI